MKLRVGYELVYECPQPTPMLLMLNTHASRAQDMLVPDHIYTDPPVPLSSIAIVRQSVHAAYRAARRAHAVARGGVRRAARSRAARSRTATSIRSKNCPTNACVFLLGSRYCETDLLSERRVANVRPHAARTRPRAGDLRLRASPHPLRLQLRAADQDRVGSIAGRRRAYAATTRIWRSRCAAR